MKGEKQWVAIPGYSKYEIDIDGNVRNAKTQKKVSPKTDNPAQVQILHDNTQVRVRVNRIELAAQIFAKTKTISNEWPTEKQVMRSKTAEKYKIFYLKEIAGKSHAQIGEIFGYSKDKVGGIYNRMIRFNEATNRAHFRAEMDSILFSVK